MSSRPIVRGIGDFAGTFAVVWVERPSVASWEKLIRDMSIGVSGLGHEADATGAHSEPRRDAISEQPGDYRGPRVASAV